MEPAVAADPRVWATVRCHVNEAQGTDTLESRVKSVFLPCLSNLSLSYCLHAWLSCQKVAANLVSRNMHTREAVSNETAEWSQWVGFYMALY